VIVTLEFGRLPNHVQEIRKRLIRQDDIVAVRTVGVASSMINVGDMLAC
jgi:hypothetical protein